ncbi:MAG: ABC transporter permease [Acholeplasmataceae bacterium]
MYILFNLVKRNVLIFLRDKAAVFFSFLSVIIIILLYILFLGKMQIDSLSDLLGNVEGSSWLVGSWIMAGILIVSSITVPLGSLGEIINDRDNGKINDFYTSPINRNILALSYLISSWIIAFMMVMINFIVGQLYILSTGGELFSFFQALKVIFLFTLSIMSFSSFFFFISLFMKSRNAFGLLGTLVGTFIGFLGGIYIPIGVLSKNVQNVMNVFPTAHVVTLMRRIYMDGAIAKVFSNAPIDAYNDYANAFGLNVYIGDYSFSSSDMLLSVISFGILFFILSALKLSKSKL